MALPGAGGTFDSDVIDDNDPHRGMSGSLFRLVAVGLLVLGVSAAIVERRAECDDCVHRSSCPERYIDGRGCCMEPRAPDPAADPGRVNDARKPGELANPPRKAAPSDADGARVVIIVRKGPACPREMVHVPGSTFQMGSPPGNGEDDERPRHAVKLSGYCIDRTEVTVAAYAACVASRKCSAVPQPGKDALTSLCNGTRPDRQDHPVNCVDWTQAEAYCAFMGKQLPSEAEWEYAAHGQEQWSFPWGNEAPSAELLNACGAECFALRKRLGLDLTIMYAGSDRWEATAPVGSFPAGTSPFGALDMAGNVAEWTKDWFFSYTGVASRFTDGPHRVVRGGSWTDNHASWVRAASRDSYNPAGRPVNVGFRCVRRD